MPRIVEVLILGTSAGIPTEGRGLPAILVRDWYGLHLLLDAGEGVQTKLARHRVPVTRIDIIAVTHPHGDHINGLPGLIQSMYMMNRRRPLTVYGNSEVASFLRETLEVEYLDLGFPINIVQIDGDGEAILWESGGDKATLSWTNACHTVESYAFAVTWTLRPRINKRLLVETGLTDPVLIKTLLSEGEVETSRGRVILDEVASTASTRTTLVYTGDTSPCRSISMLARGARLLIHDSSFASEHAEDSHERGHSTSLDAAILARDSGVSLLVLTHISARYRGGEALRLLREARTIFPNSILAWDGMRIILNV